jgi:hypothetical protein
MIKCVCINDSKKPNQIPENKWIKKGQWYTIIFAITVMPQRQLGLQLDEIILDESCHPYEYFLASRFAFTLEDLEKLQAFIKDCEQVNLSMQELMEQTELLEI